MARASLFVAASVAACASAQVATFTIDTTTVTNPAVNRKFMGCHHDYGYAQAPRGFHAEMIYGNTFDAGTCRVPSWTTRLANGAQGNTATATGTSFSSRPSTSIELHSGSEIGLVNRGICGAGMVFQAGQPYTVEAWIYAGAATTGFVELNDFGSGTTLARQEFSIVSTGPPWGSTWIHYNWTLVPSASTSCTAIPFGSDPTIDCGSSNYGPAYQCQRCGGEFVIGLSASGTAWLGYVSLMPGAWALLQGPNGPLPVNKAATDVLVQLGTTVIRSGGTVSQSMRWKDWRGPQWNRPSVAQIWGSSLLAGWGPFEVIDMCNALGIEPVVTLAYDTQDVTDWADLVEFCWGDDTTYWGSRRIADGHPQPYNITVFELGNEQYNPYYVEQVAAMEARSKAVNSPPLRYMFPDNGGLTAADAQRAVAMGLPITRLMPDIHVGATGAVEAAAGLFNNPPIPGFDVSAINAEVNANAHDMARALNEAADLIDWFTADTAITNRLYARTASFCAGTASQMDQWPQGISFFFPQQAASADGWWLQPPGYVHVMVTNTWAETTVKATQGGGNGTVPFAAQLTADGKTMVLRVVNAGTTPLPLSASFNRAAAGPTYTLWTLTGQPGDDNTPTNRTKIAPVSTPVPITAGATTIGATLPASTFAVMVVPLQ